VVGEVRFARKLLQKVVTEAGRPPQSESRLKAFESAMPDEGSVSRTPARWRHMSSWVAWLCRPFGIWR
jgi:hypothetical protein